MGKTPEGVVQKYGRKRLTENGCLVRKISYEGRRGCPDQLVLVPPQWNKYTCGYDDPSVLFIEYKKDENTEPDPHQLREIERMRAHGADAFIIGSKEQVDALIEELFPS